MPLWPTAKRRLPAADWEAVYQQWSARGVRFAFGLLHSHADAEEAVQEAFYRLWVSRTWDHDLETWGPMFFTTIRNLAIDLLRQRGRRPCVSIAAMEDLMDPRKDDESQPSPDVVRQLIDRLPDPWRDALQLRVDAELSYQEIAQVLHCTSAQVRTWIYRARRRLAEQLREQGWQHDVGARHESVS